MNKIIEQKEHINKVTNLMKEYQVSSKKQECKILKAINPETLARITAIISIDSARNYDSVAAVTNKIGREIMIPYLNESKTEEQQQVQCAKVGWDMLCVMTNAGYLGIAKRTFKPKKGQEIKPTKTKTAEQVLEGIQQRMPNIVTIKYEANCNHLYEEVMVHNSEQDSLSHKPQYTKPEDWNKPFHPVFGKMMRNANPKIWDNISKKQIPTVYKCINKLQSTPLAINHDVLEAAIWSLQDDILTLRDKSLEDEQRDSKYMSAAKSIELAQEIGDRTFYTGYYVAFNGRVFPTMQGINLVGSGLSKALVCLGKKKSITRAGIEWLKLHIANCCGKDKLPLDERIKWTENNWNELASYSQYKINKGWQYLKEPFSALGAISELVRAYQAPFPHLYQTGILVAFDCTNSGAQLLSGMVRDREGMRLTNLLDLENRGDLYIEVAKWCWNNLPADSYWHKHSDDMRSISKTAVMTKFYNSGYRTMAKAMYEELSPDKEHNNLRYQDCIVLAKLIFDGCAIILPGAISVMNMLSKLADKFNEEDADLNVTIASNNFPLIAYYREDKVKKMCLYNNGVKTSVNVCVGRNKRLKGDKQTISAPAIIVHAIDASLVHNLVARTKYDILSIHDSYLCHPADAGDMFEDSRESLTWVLEQPLLERIVGDKLVLQDEVEIGEETLGGIVNNDFCIS